MTFKEWFNQPKVQGNYLKRLRNASPGLWEFIIKQDFEVIFKKHNLSEMSLNNFNSQTKRSKSNGSTNSLE